MPSSAEVCLGVIVAVAIVAIARHAWLVLRKPRQCTYQTPAGAELTEAAHALAAVLDRIRARGAELTSAPTDEELPADPLLAPPVDEEAPAAPPLAPGIAESVRGITAATERVSAMLWAPKPTYASFHAVYSGLCDSDALYLRTADSYLALAAKMSGGNLAALAHLGGELRRVPPAVHQLGAALNLE